MPRKSPFAIELTAQERERLEALARSYTSPYRDVIRAKIVLYAAAGLRNDEIGERLDMPRQIVSKWRKRFAEERMPGLAEKSRRGHDPGAHTRSRAAAGSRSPPEARQPRSSQKSASHRRAERVMTKGRKTK